jgi:hypothetical protein
VPECDKLEHSSVLRLSDNCRPQRASRPPTDLLTSAHHLR